MNFKIIAAGIKNLIVKRTIGPFWLRRKQLAKTQWWSRQDLELLQLKLLKRLVSHCYNTVPYYRKLMDELNIKVGDIKTLDDLRRFPILSKKDVLCAGDSIISTKYPRWTLRKARTGGSTGTPMTIYRNLFSIGNEHAFVRRQWDWAEIGLRDRCAFLMSRVVAHPDQKGGCLYAFDPFMRDLILSTHHLSNETAKDYLAAVRQYKIKALVGYPSAINLMALACLDMGFDLKLKAVLTTSETITQPVKDTITRAFHCPVYDFYGGLKGSVIFIPVRMETTMLSQNMV